MDSKPEATASASKKEHTSSKFKHSASWTPNAARKPGGKDPKASASSGIKKHVTTHGTTRILLVSEIRGQYSQLNSLVAETEADCVISVGNFGFFDEESVRSVPAHCLPNPDTPATNRAPHRVQYKGDVCGEFAALVRGDIKLAVPVYAIFGSFEDVRVVAKIRDQTYKVPNLFLLDETHSFVVANNLRVFGVGGLLEYHRLFDYAEGVEWGVAGAEGRMWPTAINIGNLLNHAASVFNPSETRLLVSFSPVFSDGLLTQLAIQLKAHATASKCSISCDMNFYENAFHKREDIHRRFDESVAELAGVWQSVHAQVTQQCSDDEWLAVERTLKLADVELSEAYYRTTWHFCIANIRRNSSTVLLASHTLGFESRHPGIEVRRLFDDAQQQEAAKGKDDDHKKRSTTA